MFSNSLLIGFNCHHVNWGYDDKIPDGGDRVLGCLVKYKLSFPHCQGFCQLLLRLLEHWQQSRSTVAFANIGLNNHLPDRRVFEKFPRSQHQPLLITSPRFAFSVTSMPSTLTAACWMQFGSLEEVTVSNFC